MPSKIHRGIVPRFLRHGATATTKRMNPLSWVAGEARSKKSPLRVNVQNGFATIQGYGIEADAKVEGRFCAPSQPRDSEKPTNTAQCPNLSAKSFCIRFQESSSAFLSYFRPSMPCESASGTVKLWRTPG